MKKTLSYLFALLLVTFLLLLPASVFSESLNNGPFGLEIFTSKINIQEEVTASRCEILPVFLTDKLSTDLHINYIIAADGIIPKKTVLQIARFTERIRDGPKVI